MDYCRRHTHRAVPAARFAWKRWRRYRRMAQDRNFGSIGPVANSSSNLPVQSVGVSEWVHGDGECYHWYHE